VLWTIAKILLLLKLSRHCRFRPNVNTREAGFRRGTEFEEKIGIKREWIHPWRISKKTQQPAYYDIVIQELGKNFC
jgi:hypothetical protein